LILLFGICMLSLYEYYTLAEEAGWPVSKKTGLLCGAALALSIFTFGTKMGWTRFPSEIFFSPAVLSLILIGLVLGTMAARDRGNAFQDIAMTALGLFYVVWNLSHLALIRDLRPDGRLYTFFLFFVIWAMDIGAYGGGARFGRRQLSETLSPKKTWEGVFFGILCSLIAAGLCQAAFLRSVRLSVTLTLALVMAVLGQLSDLSESLFKRNVQVKDSGSLLPGHGGILDRFDSFLLTSPVYYYILIFVIRS
jgi:phosphatidate cytidylyltransferase